MGDDPRLPPVDEVQALRAAACDWRLARGDLGVFAVILEHCNADGESFPGPALIAKKARLAVTNVKSSIQRLEALRYIEVMRPGLRKKNRFKVTFKPLHILPRDTGMPSQLKREVARHKANSSREHSQSKGSTTASTGDARMHSTGHARMNKLGMQARQEVAFKSHSEITGASRSFRSSEEQEQERSPEEQSRLTESARKMYLEAVRTGNERLMQSVERNHWHRIADLVPDGRLRPLAA